MSRVRRRVRGRRCRRPDHGRRRHRRSRRRRGPGAAGSRGGSPGATSAAPPATPPTGPGRSACSHSPHTESASLPQCGIAAERRHPRCAYLGRLRSTKALDVRGLIWRVCQDGSVNGHRCQSGGSSVAGAGGWSRPTAWTRARSPWKSGLRRSARHDRCATNDAHPGPSLLRTSTLTPSPPGLSTVSSPQHPHGQLNSRRSEARIVRRTQRGGWYLLISWTTASTCSPIGGYSSGSARDVPDGLSMKPASTDEPTVSCPRTAVITPQRSWLTMVARTAAPTTRSPPRLSKRCIG